MSSVCDWPEFFVRKFMPLLTHSLVSVYLRYVHSQGFVPADGYLNACLAMNVG